MLWATATPVLERLLEKQRNICGPTHPSTIATMFTLARNYANADRFTESLPLFEKRIVASPAGTVAGMSNA